MSVYISRVQEGVDRYWLITADHPYELAKVAKLYQARLSGTVRKRVVKVTDRQRARKKVYEQAVLGGVNARNDASEKFLNDYQQRIRDTRRDESDRGAADSSSQRVSQGRKQLIL